MFRHRLLLTLGFFLALGWLGHAPVRTPGAPGGQRKQSPETAPASKVIKAEANLVLVDVAVTDKKKHYLEDLGQKEFHVFEDGVEQNIVSFSREADIKANAPERKRYMVLFFDNTMMTPTSQMEERQAAAKFVEMTASPDRMMAVMDFGGVLHVAQNFTANGDLLNNAVQTIKFSAVQTNAPRGRGSRGGRLQADYATRTLLLAIRDVAKMLSPVPGRKIMLFFSAGFVLSSERQADFQDTLDALNKANVAVYAVGAQGLSATGGSAAGRVSDFGSAQARRPSSRPARIRSSASFNEDVLRSFASNTGGFPIVDTNDLLGGMVKVSEEMDESYILAYVPPNPAHEGRYHKIRVKVDRPGAEIRARGGYFDTKSPDLLAGKPEGKTLEARAASSDPGDIPVSLSAPYFYVQPGVALVDLALSIPGSSIDFEKQKGGFHSQVNVLGIAYRDDGSVAARFSDTVNVDHDKQEKQTIDKTAFEYEKCFKIAPGTYVLKVVLSTGGQKFGKYALPLVVDPFSGKEFTLGGPAFGERIAVVTPQTEDMDETLLENTKPLIANGVQVVPSASNRFAKNMQPDFYVEVYNPLLTTGKVQVGIQVNIVDRKTKRTIFSSGMMPINQFARAGNPLVPLNLMLPMDKLPPGDYRIEIQGGDSAGNVSALRTGDFSVE